jgi:hypothetical protein
MDPLDYPFEIPDASFLFAAGQAHPLVGFDPQRARAQGRRPVLAVGSNASPRQLARKFDGCPGAAIPVTRVRVQGLTPVYSAHVARRGYLPATPWHEPGVVTTSFVGWLDAEQLLVMHRSEGGNYDYLPLGGIRCELDGVPLEGVHAYFSLHGCLARDEVPIALSALAPPESALPRMDQRQVMDYVSGLLSAQGAGPGPLRGVRALAASFPGVRED